MIVMISKTIRFFVSAVEGWMSSSRGAFVVVGDSITDGRESITDENNR